MPVSRRTIGGVPDPGAFRGVADELGRELAGPKPFGQPMVVEDTFARTGRIAVTVVWDTWSDVPDARRSSVIKAAYETARGVEARDRIGFALGLTFREAAEDGKLPFAVVANLRRDDPVTPEQVQDAFRELGGGLVGPAGSPVVLHLPTVEDAEACRRELIRRFPGTDEVWAVTEEPYAPPRFDG